MRAITIKEAKAHLNELVDAAVGGQEVELMRGSQHVVALVPITADDLELASRLTDDQAAALWRSLASEAERGTLAEFDSPEQAVAFLTG